LYFVSLTVDRSRDSHLQCPNKQVVIRVSLKLSWKKHSLKMSLFRIF